jgi:hypothetical protein
LDRNLIFLRSANSIFTLRNALYAVTFFGITLALIQYFYNRSLWLDEASLAINILDRSFLRLLHPLSYIQVAPVGFLFAEKFFVIILGPNEYALRLFPLLSYLGTIPVYYLALKNLTRDITLTALCTATLSLSYSMIYYASEVKQYAVDVLIASLFLLIASSKQHGRISQFVILMVFGSIAIWFSHISVILLIVIGIYLFWKAYSDRRSPALYSSLGLTLLSFSTYYLLFIHEHPSTQFMQEYWRNAFMPFPGDITAFVEFLHHSVKGIFVHVFTLDKYWPYGAGVMLAGIFFLVYRKRYSVLYLCLAPLFVHLLLSLLHLYPFAGRLLLYLLPGMIVLFISGIYYAFGYFKKRVLALPEMLLFIPVLILCYPLYLRFPIEKSEIKKCIRIVEAGHKRGDDVYTFHLSRRAMQYYQMTGYTSIDSADVRNLVYTDTEQLHRDLSVLQGKLWLMISHISPNAEPNLEENMLTFLEDHGARVQERWSFKGCRCYCIDMGEAQQDLKGQGH